MGSEEIKSIIVDYIFEMYTVDESICEPTSRLSDYMSSLEMVEFVMFLEDRFDIQIPDDVWPDWEYLTEVLKYVEDKINNK